MPSVSQRIYANGVPADMSLWWWEDGVDTATNSSMIHFRGTITNPNSAPLWAGSPATALILRGGTNRSDGWNDWTIHSLATPSLDGNATLTCYGDYRIPHLDDGSLMVWATLTHQKNDGNSWVPPTTAIGTGYGYCTTIPRTATVSSYVLPEDWLGSFKIAYTASTPSFSHKLRVSIPQVKEIMRVENYSSNQEVQLNAAAQTAVWEYLKDKQSLTIGIALETWNGSTKVGESTEYQKIYTPTDPITCTATVTEIALAGKGVGAYDAVGIIGKKKVSVRATCNHSTPTIKIEIGGVVKIFEAVSGKDYDIEIEGMTSNNFRITATNTHGGKATALDKTGNYYNYFAPRIIEAKAERLSVDSGNGKIAATITYYTGNIGNVVGKDISYSLTGDKEATGAASGNSNIAIVNIPLSGLERTQSYSYTLKVVDGFGKSSSIVIRLTKAIPTIAFGDTVVQINDTLQFYGDNPAIFYLGDAAFEKVGADQRINVDGNWSKIAALRTGLPNSQSSCHLKIHDGLEFSEIFLSVVSTTSGITLLNNNSWYDGRDRGNIRTVRNSDRTVDIWYFKNKNNKNAYTIKAEATMMLPNMLTLVGEFPPTYRDNVNDVPPLVFNKLNHKTLSQMPVGWILQIIHNSYDPNIVLGGRWQKVPDKILMGAGASVGIGGTAGSLTHTHGELHGRNGTLSAAIGATSNNAISIGYMVANDQSVGTMGYPTYTVWGSSYDGNNRYFNHFTKVFGATSEGSSLPPVLGVNIWRRIG